MKINQTAYEICIQGILHGQSKQDIYIRLDNILDSKPSERTYRNWIMRAKSAITDAGYDISKGYTDKQITEIIRQLQMPKHGNSVRSKVQQRIIDSMIPDGSMYSIDSLVELLSREYTAYQVRHAFWDLQLHTKLKKAPYVRKYWYNMPPKFKKDALKKKHDPIDLKKKHYVFLSVNIVSYDDLGLSAFEHDQSIRLICLYYGFGMIHIYPTLQVDKDTIINIIMIDIKSISGKKCFNRTDKLPAYRVFISKNDFDRYDLHSWHLEKGLDLRILGRFPKKHAK